MKKRIGIYFADPGDDGVQIPPVNPVDDGIVIPDTPVDNK